MSRPRFFLTDTMTAPVGATVPLPLSAEDVHHAARVLRITSGEEIDVVDPDGTAWVVRVADLTADGITGELVVVLEPPAAPRVALFQGIAKGEKMDTIVKQAVEVGVARIVPVVTSRTVVRLDERKRADRGARWRRIAESAAKQARREAVPAVDDPLDFATALEQLGCYEGVLVLWEDHSGRLLSAALRPLMRDSAARVALVVGPEGGLSAEEVDALVAVGAAPVSLGPSILRTETAAVVALGLAAAAALEAAHPA